MAPEQVRGERADARSDLYAAGLTLFEAWTGEPYIADHRQGGAREVDAETAEGDDGPGPSPDIRALFARALAHDPGDRFEDAATMRDAVLAALARAKSDGREPTS